jgi:hypothetical protein
MQAFVAKNPVLQGRDMDENSSPKSKMSERAGRCYKQVTPTELGTL